MPSLEPVEGNPFDNKLEPVEGNPFESKAPDLASVNSMGYPIPQPFIDRLNKGTSVNRILQSAVDSFKDGLGAEPVTGISDETRQQMQDLGIIHDPATGPPGPVHLFNEAMIIPAAKAFETVMRGANAGLYSAAGALGQLHEELGGSQGEAARTKTEAINAGNWALIESGMGRFVRPGAPMDAVVGSLPRDADFTNAAKVIGDEQAAPRLKDMWQEQGLHPSEVAHDAQADAFIKHDLTAKAEEAVPHELGAAVNTLPEDVPPSVQPTQSPGKLSAAISATTDKLFDLGRDAQRLVSPMAMGTRDSMAIAKDFANTMRRNRWEWSRIDSDIAHSFTPEQRTRMFNAADEESVLRQEGNGSYQASRAKYDEDVKAWRDRKIELENDRIAAGKAMQDILVNDKGERISINEARKSGDFQPLEKRYKDLNDQWHAHMEQEPKIPTANEHMGLATLEPAERAKVEELQTRAQSAWVRARDLGMVEGEGLPAYTPRMIINAATATSGDTAVPLNGIGMNLKVRTANMMRRQYLTVEETEAAAKKALGADAQIARDIRVLPLATARLEDAIAGRSLINSIKDYGKSTGTETVAEGAIPTGTDQKWFTLDHPAFRTWRPKFDEGKVVKDADGNTIFEQVPLYVHSDFEGPLRAVLTQRSGPIYQAAMSLKGKTMGLIMNSPMIHNAVEFGRAFPAMPIRIFKAYFDGNRAKNDLAIMREAIDNGLVPIGKRFFNQDINSIMEAPDLTPGRSWTAKALGETVGRFPQKGMSMEEVMTQVKRDVDKAGDFWHNTLLWDRIADLQMGIYTNLRGDLLAKGVDQQTSSRIAAHFANRYAGALPQEAMSATATKVANFMLFSRTFTLGNLGVMKDVLTGLPKDVMAQIERDTGTIDPKAAGYAKAVARRKAMSVVALDIALLYGGNSVLQSALNVMLGDSSLSDEAHGYAKRLKEVTNDVNAHPLSMLQPLDLVGRLSATSENEPGKQDRLKIGYAKDGTAIYARNPIGKIGEEFTGYLSGPLDMLRKKQGTIARPMLQVLNNDKGFGRKIYDPDAETPAAKAGVIWNMVEHFMKAQVPEGQLGALSDLVHGDGDSKVNTLQVLGPMAGVTFSKGAPGGPPVGEMYRAREQAQYKWYSQLPDIQKQFLRGDQNGARQAMQELGIPPGLARWYTRVWQNPALRLSPRALHDFQQYATPEQRARMENARSIPGPLTPSQ